MRAHVKSGKILLKYSKFLAHIYEYIYVNIYSKSFQVTRENARIIFSYLYEYMKKDRRRVAWLILYLRISKYRICLSELIFVLHKSFSNKSGRFI